MNERIIETEKCLKEGSLYLADRFPEFSYAMDLIGSLNLRRRPEGFSQLLSAIVSQQLSVAAANSIWSRLKSAQLIGLRKIRSASDEELAAAGLSRQKIKYARALADSKINYSKLRSMASEEVIAELTRVSGIGPWTAEIYTMFSLGRADVFAPGDLALQESARLLFDWSSRPKEKEFRELAKSWSPWRSVAARILWSYYGKVKERDGIR
mgnify:CR=1 FL=1